MQFQGYFMITVLTDGSDRYAWTGASPSARIDGVPRTLDKDPLSPERVREIAYELMGAEQSREFKAKQQLNLASYESGCGQLRVNVRPSTVDCTETPSGARNVIPVTCSQEP